MTPEQKIKWSILLAYKEAANLPEITAENIDELYEKVGENYELQDNEYEARCGDIETKIPCESCRHFESKSVAAEMPDGSWVGWTYWYGGGKHAEPDAIDWMDKAYDLDYAEETVVVKKFFKKK